MDNHSDAPKVGNGLFGDTSTQAGSIVGRSPVQGREVDRVSIVVPVFNEAEVLPLLFAHLAAILDRMPSQSEVVLVNDGSQDPSLVLLLDQCRRDPRFKVVDLSRNFGHQVAISAGLDHCAGDVAIIMDADLQDPPEVIWEMLARWRDGYDIVYGIRKEREGETRFKVVSARLFYRLLSRVAGIDVPPDAGDFRLVDRKVIEAFRSMPERDRYVRGMFSWLGFRQCGVAFNRRPRAGGRTKYSLAKMLRLASNGVLGFSDAPLRFITGIGLACALFALLGGVAAVVISALGVPVVRGWTSLVLIETFLMGVNFIVLGIIGMYVGRIHEEVKERPLYLVGGLYNFSGDRSAGGISGRAQKN
jgi:polyisoprenyl-phosphate glycosyltransferase